MSQFQTWVVENKSLLNEIYDYFVDSIQIESTLTMESENLFHLFSHMIYTSYYLKHPYQSKYDKDEFLDLSYESWNANIFSTFRTIAFHYQSTLFTNNQSSLDLHLFFLDHVTLLESIDTDENTSEEDEN